SIGGRADAYLRREIALRRQPIAGLERATLDERTDVRHDLASTAFGLRVRGQATREAGRSLSQRGSGHSVERRGITTCCRKVSNSRNGHASFPVTRDRKQAH